MPFPDDCIDADIDQQYKQGEQVLNVLCQACRIDQRGKIVFDKPAFAAGADGLVAKPVFKRGQRADPAKQFDQDAPGNAGEVQPCKPGTAQYQQAANHNKEDESGMQDKDQVGKRVDNQRTSFFPSGENRDTRQAARVKTAGPGSIPGRSSISSPVRGCFAASPPVNRPMLKSMTQGADARYKATGNRPSDDAL